VFCAEWRNAGGSLDVLERATGNKITGVGNATAADVGRYCRKSIFGVGAKKSISKTSQH
jgi:hypothetical protein